MWSCKLTKQSSSQLFTISYRSTAWEEIENEETPESFRGALPDPMQLEWYKKYRENEAKTMSAFKSLTFFVLFLLILGIVCYGNRDYHQYLMGREIKAIFPRVQKASIYFHFLFSVFLLIFFHLELSILAVASFRLALNIQVTTWVLCGFSCYLRYRT